LICANHFIANINTPLLSDVSNHSGSKKSLNIEKQNKEEVSLIFSQPQRDSNMPVNMEGKQE